MLIMWKVRTILFTTLVACVPATPQTSEWGQSGAELLLSVSAPAISKDQIVFVVAAINSSSVEVCFDGNATFPLGLGLINASNGALLSYSNLPGDRDVGHIAAVVFDQYMLAPKASQSFMIALPRPIAGPYQIPFVSAFYKVGDLLQAIASTEFYDCSYGSVQRAAAEGQSVVKSSTPSEPFREN